MSNIPTAPAGAPDPDAQELAARQNIPLEEAQRIISERGNDRGAVDAEVQKQKLGQDS
ncbi:hypothetical protein [Aureimonas psammosilenae]|uniref:hypothetical protein n=1 Tax=Aureimonas psammosilenae TaxID=2495496 RepID=UPI0018698FC3|nr:hypothetical protein [Aureimonas psammosilenae]